MHTDIKDKLHPRIEKRELMDDLLFSLLSTVLNAYFHLYFPEAGVQVQIPGYGHRVLQAQGEDGEHEPHA